MTYAKAEYLIEAPALADRLEDVLILDATVFLRPAERGYRAESGFDQYLTGHVPGAGFLDQIADVSDTSTGLGFSLPAPEALEQGLQKAGVSNGRPVVLYSSAHMMWATRAWWLLHYAGHDQVAVLNGGLDAWKAAGLPLQQDPVEPAHGDFRISPRAERFVDKEAVLAAMGDSAVCTVNALAPGVYSGEAEFSYGRKGHITGSINLHYDDLLDDGRFRPAEALRESLAAAGLLDAGRVIAYCGGGISATIDAFACLLVGKNEVAVYDGSMSEWVRDESLPMTTGAAPG